MGKSMPDSTTSKSSRNRTEPGLPGAGSGECNHSDGSIVEVKLRGETKQRLTWTRSRRTDTPCCRLGAS